MSGEELKQYIKRSGLTMSDVARELGTTPQNVQARLGRKTIKIDFIQKIKEIIEKKYLRCLQDEKGYRRAVNGLQRLGYRYEDIRQAILCFSLEADEDIYYE